ncbi:hypothetical protein Pcinc_029402 [Petrolisthes cinctipes]|uniref:Uncharacterized protein n=1 Tax=Petrolisthes cinctipes TaxID=88211 RepID=A0AAE1F103_PETCI|nr:hypothetical protein Pcinc_029402 [Petrolisthes cinctipes]
MVAAAGKEMVEEGAGAREMMIAAAAVVVVVVVVVGDRTGREEQYGKRLLRGETKILQRDDQERVHGGLKERDTTKEI